MIVDYDIFQEILEVLDLAEAYKKTFTFSHSVPTNQQLKDRIQILNTFYNEVNKWIMKNNSNFKKWQLEGQLNIVIRHILQLEKRLKTKQGA